MKRLRDSARAVATALCRRKMRGLQTARDAQTTLVTPTQRRRYSACIVIASLIVSQTLALADIPWDEVKQRVKEENARLASRPGGHDGTYFVVCTIYYTPQETGFTAERGFDVTPTAAPGLKDAKFPRDFLRAVKLEGYGRMATPVKGKQYLAYDNGVYHYDAAPRARGISPLEPRVSAAARRWGVPLPKGTELITTDGEIEKVFGATRWKVVDTGGGLRRWQLDLYWGEDDPLTPERIGRPAGTQFEYGYTEVKIVRPEKENAPSAPN